MKNQSIKKIVKTPSAALQFMVDGLRKQSKREDFFVSMSTFGSSDGETCFGCAATCAIQELTGTNLTVKEINGVEERAKALNFDLGELEHFECCINDAREGVLFNLFSFFGLLDKYESNYDDRFFLGSVDWKNQLTAVEKLIKELKEKGL